LEARKMTNSKRHLIAALAISAPVVAVLLLAKVMLPVKEGNSADFWNDACGVDIGGAEKDTLGGVYQPRDGWYIYYVQGFDQQFLFRVPRDQAVAAFPEVVRKIKISASRTNAPPIVRRAAAILDRNSSTADLRPDEFLSLINDDRLRALRERDPSLYAYEASDEQAFEARWLKIRHYWMNVVFESAYFGGLSLFVLWPWLRRRSGWCWGVHLGSLPVLLMLPYYCGYATWTFTGVGPSGGIFYPWVIFCFRDFPIWTGADQWALENVPKFLAPLSQSPGPMLASSGGGTLGPVTALLIGAGITICISAGVRFAKLGKQQILSD
jgi:hypothetical protein